MSVLRHSPALVLVLGLGALPTVHAAPPDARVDAAEVGDGDGEGEDELEGEGEDEVEDEDEPGSAVVTLDEPKWIKHRIIPGERLGDIADRYGVTTQKLIRWNKLDAKKPKIFAGRDLAVYTKTIPPPQQKIVYEVQFGDTWKKIADDHHVDIDDLRERWNAKVPRKFKAGQELVIWVDPLDDPNFGRGGHGGKSGAGASSPPLPLVAIPRHAKSVGKPNDGRIANSAQLPENKQLYTIRNPDESYGSSHTLEHLQLAVAHWRRDSGFAGALMIGDISKQGGGKLKPHSSHRSGRDVDIRLPVKRKDGSADVVADVDWDATWDLIVAFANTGEVDRIYLTTDRQAQVHKAAKRAGASADLIDKLLQYPETGGRNNGLVRHSKGHTAHMHVRFKCGSSESTCEDAR